MKSVRIALVALIALSSLACSTTTFESTWRAPGARPVRLAGRRVVGLFVGRNPAVRRRAEDAMAREISAREAEGVPAYTVLSDEEIKDQDAARKKLDGLGLSGVVVMRVVGRETEYSYDPAVVWARPPYRHFWRDYWSWGWARVGEPQYLAVDRIVKVETLVYSLEQDMLIWAGVSRTVDPEHVEGLIEELSRAVSEKMAADRLLGNGKRGA